MYGSIMWVVKVPAVSSASGGIKGDGSGSHLESVLCGLAARGLHKKDGRGGMLECPIVLVEFVSSNKSTATPMKEESEHQGDEDECQATKANH